MKRFYGGVISGSTNITGSGFLSPATVQLQPSSSTVMDATGGTISYSGNYKIHTFLTSGTFTVTTALNTLVEYLVIAGGGGGGSGTSSAGNNGGGGGGGGFLEYVSGTVDGSDFSGAKILANSGDSFTINIGAGGAKQANGGTSEIIHSKYYVGSIGGGYGCPGASSSTGSKSGNGGSNGGNLNETLNGNVYSAGVEVYRPRQGYAANNKFGGSGAGGAATGSAGASGRASAIDGNTYSAGGQGVYPSSSAPGAAAANTGNGGIGTQGGSGYKSASAGGSGIVILRYLYQ